MRATLLCLLFSVSTVAHAGNLSIIPQPERIRQLDTYFKLDKETRIVASSQEEKKSARFFTDYLYRHYGIRISISDHHLPSQNSVFFVIDEKPNAIEGEYELVVDKNAVRLNGSNKEGLFYAMQTLIQLLPGAPNRELRVPGVEIYDKPRFGYRGMHLDVVRHIFPLDYLKTYIDYLALHKLNRFHLHLTDDQGWRFESKRYPELNSIGSWRNGSIIGIFPGTDFDEARYGGYYTVEELKELIAYAADRYITIVPEIDIPAHCMAVIATFPQFSTTPDVPKEPATTWGIYNRQNNVLAPSEEVFEFLENVFTELMDIFPSPYIHIGADECAHKWWKESPQTQDFIRRNNLGDEKGLQKYFVQRVYEHVARSGRKVIGWDDIVDDGGMVGDIMVMAWRHERNGYKAADMGHEVILCPQRFSYFNIQQRDDEKRISHRSRTVRIEDVYGFEPVPDSIPQEAAARILGGQGCLWAEYYHTEAQVEYGIFPRLSALAEVYWSRKDLRDWEHFKQKLPAQFDRYDLWRAKYSDYLFETGELPGRHEEPQKQ